LTSLQPELSGCISACREITVHKQQISGANVINQDLFTINILLTLSVPVSLYKFLLLVSIHFVEYQLGELVYTSRQFIFGDHFPNSHDQCVLKCTDMMRGNLMLITIGAKRVNMQHP